MSLGVDLPVVGVTALTSLFSCFGRHDPGGLRLHSGRRAHYCADGPHTIVRLQPDRRTARRQGRHGRTHRLRCYSEQVDAPAGLPRDKEPAATPVRPFGRNVIGFRRRAGRAALGGTPAIPVE
jgi:hypothetical protein